MSYRNNFDSLVRLLILEDDDAELPIIENLKQFKGRMSEDRKKKLFAALKSELESRIPLSLVLKEALRKNPAFPTRARKRSMDLLLRDAVSITVMPIEVMVQLITSLKIPFEQFQNAAIYSFELLVAASRRPPLESSKAFIVSRSFTNSSKNLLTEVPSLEEVINYLEKVRLRLNQEDNPL